MLAARMRQTEYAVSPVDLGWPFLLLTLLLMAPWPSVGHAASHTDTLEITTDPAGGVHARARVLFPAATEVIQGLLTDYPRWPDLFEVRMRLAEWHVRDGVATIDLRLEHALLPGERRLVTESRTLPDGGLVTVLKGGDFKRYHRVWTLRPASQGNETSADFELLFELDSLVPDWIMALAVRQELEAHFRIVKQKALERSRH
jgi:Polyketide cyclase / dehydrase and lipid transport